MASSALANPTKGCETSTFAKGASLKDPARLFNSSLEGNTRRAIDIHEGEEVDDSAAQGAYSPGGRAEQFRQVESCEEISDSIAACLRCARACRCEVGSAPGRHNRTGGPASTGIRRSTSVRLLPLS